MEIIPDPVRLLIKCGPQYGIHRVVKQLRAYAPKVLREDQIPNKSIAIRVDAFYCIATVWTAQLDVIKTYIEEQKSR